MESSSQNSLTNFYQVRFEELKEIERFVTYQFVCAETDPNPEESLWEIVYDRVFCKKCSVRVFELCNDMGSRLDYYDPDTSYEEDVKAFIYALREKIAQFERLNV